MHKHNHYNDKHQLYLECDIRKYLSTILNVLRHRSSTHRQNPLRQKSLSLQENVLCYIIFWLLLWGLF